MSFLKKAFLPILLVCCAGLVLASSEMPDLTSPEFADHSVSLIMPINALQAEKISLLVTIPKAFKALASKNPRMDEFILKNDTNPSMWSKIITVQRYIGYRIGAKILLDGVLQGIQRADPSCTVIATSLESEALFETYTLAVLYRDPIKNRQEVLYAKFFSGPYDCSGIQYSVALTEGVLFFDTLMEIKEFVDKNVSVLRASE